MAETACDIVDNSALYYRSGIRINSGSLKASGGAIGAIKESTLDAKGREMISEAGFTGTQFAARVLAHSQSDSSMR